MRAADNTAIHGNGAPDGRRGRHPLLTRIEGTNSKQPDGTRRIGLFEGKDIRTKRMGNYNSVASSADSGRSRSAARHSSNSS